MNCPNCARALDNKDSKECLSCGVILSKWYARTSPRSETAPAPAARAGGSGPSWTTWILLIAAAAGAWRWLQVPHISGQSGQRWEEADEENFESKVLHSPLPVLVYFDAYAENGHQYEAVFFSLQSKYNHRLKIVHVRLFNAPHLAQTYYEENLPVMLVCFKDGREIRRSAMNPFLEGAAAASTAALQQEVNAKAKDIHSAEGAALLAVRYGGDHDITYDKAFQENIEKELESFIEPL